MRIAVQEPGQPHRDLGLIHVGSGGTLRNPARGQGALVVGRARRVRAAKGSCASVFKNVCYNRIETIVRVIGMAYFLMTPDFIASTPKCGLDQLCTKVHTCYSNNLLL